MDQKQIGSGHQILREIRERMAKLEQLLGQAEYDRHTNCPKCQAEGRVWVRTGLTGEALMTCPDCYGDGFVERRAT